MTSSSPRKVLVVVGLGKGAGTGASVARQFAKAGYSVALITTRAETLDTLSKEIESTGGEASSFPVAAYDASEMTTAWKAVTTKFSAPEYRISVAVFNAAHFVMKPFTEVLSNEVKDTLTTVEAAFAFSKGAVDAFKANSISEPEGKRGTLIITGAGFSVNAAPLFSVLSAQKFAMRALAQGLNKELGKENIHVAHVIIAGYILTERLGTYMPDAVNDPNARLDPDSIAQSYLYLVNQDRSAWTWELDLRPAHMKW